MHQHNSPGRKNDRRIGAIGQLERQLASNAKKNERGHYDPLDASDRARIRQEIDTLTLRLVSREAARAVRTKKTPQDLWSDARRAWRRGRITRA